MIEGQQQSGESVTRMAPRAIGAAAVIIMLGNLSTSLLGFVRQAVMFHTFGRTMYTDAFVAASTVPQMFYDLTIGAAVSAALIPTLTELLHRQGKEAVARVSGTVLGVVWIVLALVTAGLFLAARPVMSLLLHAGGSRHPGELAQSVVLVRILLPSLLFLGTSAVLLATLYSVRRFTVPAFATAFFHLGIVAGAVFLARPLGIAALALGAVVGAAAQAVVQGPALLRAGLHLKIRFALTPEIKAIVRLYAPVAIGLLVSIAGQVIDLNFKSQLSTGGISAMSGATTLTQFPIGIAVAALSFAILPNLSSAAALGNIGEFKETLTFGIRFVLFLTVPAAIVYLALGVPIIRLLFQTGHFTSSDTSQMGSALMGYAPQIPFVGLDQLLIFAFYARKNTRTPMLVGVVGVGIYVASALLLRPAFQIFGLALANTLQNSLHAAILLVLLLMSVGTLQGYSLLGSISRTCVAGVAMGCAAAAASFVMQRAGTTGIVAHALSVVFPGCCAVAVYIGVAAALGSDELRTTVSIARARHSS